VSASQPIATAGREVRRLPDVSRHCQMRRQHQHSCDVHDDVALKLTSR
jgi:hypothetical protein